MTLEEYLTLVRGVPLPTDAQFRDFARHVAVAHSWYKHLSLVEGADFVVYLDPLAGGDFPPEQPRLHHTWATTVEYRRQFGHLAYMWRPRDRPGSAMVNDYGTNARVTLVPPGEARLVDQRDTPLLELPPEVVKACGFLLYPFVCDNEVLCWRFEAELRDMEDGRMEHPCRDLLVSFWKTSRASKEAEKERRRACERRFEAGVPSAPGATTPRAGDAIDRRAYEEAERAHLWAILRGRIAGDTDRAEGLLTGDQHEYLDAHMRHRDAWTKLQRHETSKIEGAVARLRALLESGSAASPRPALG